MAPPRKKKKPLRTADGRPEFRSPDQILRDAASDLSGDLPTKEKKLDLDAYFRSGEEHRVAHQLLKDNGILPQHLQDRKDAEDARSAAEAGLEQSVTRLSETTRDLPALAAVVTGFVGDVHAIDAAFPGMPTPLPPPPGSVSARDADDALDRLIDTVNAHNQVRLDALASYREGLERANAASDRYHKHVQATGQLVPVYPGAIRTDIDARLNAAADRLPGAIHPDSERIEAIRAEVRTRRSLRYRVRQALGLGTRT